MNIHFVDGFEKADQCVGLTVVIDVFRAFSTVHYLFEQGIQEIIAVAQPEIALQYKQTYPHALLVGERDGRKIDGFDYGNSPTFLLQNPLSQTQAIFTTTAGTTGMLGAVHATEIITGSFLNVGANIRYILQQNPAELTLLSTKSEISKWTAHEINEDWLCAQYMAALLQNRTMPFHMIERDIRTYSAQRFMAPQNQDWSPRQDYDLCMELNKFDGVVRGTRQNHAVYLTRERIDHE